MRSFQTKSLSSLQLCPPQTGAPNSRSTQIFINLGGNERLDADGFAPFGEIVNPAGGGGDPLSIVAAAREAADGDPRQPDQSQVQMQGQQYLKDFPDLTKVVSAKLV